MQRSPSLTAGAAFFGSGYKSRHDAEYSQTNDCQHRAGTRCNDKILLFPAQAGNHKRGRQEHIQQHSPAGQGIHTGEQEQWFQNHWLLQYDLMFGEEYALTQ